MMPDKMIPAPQRTRRSGDCVKPDSHRNDAIKLISLAFIMMVILISQLTAAELRGTGDLGLIIERADSSIQIIETSTGTSLGRIEGLGDLSHASAVYSRDQRYAYIFGRDGGLNKVDMLTRKLVKRIIQSGNAIGGAISDDGKMIAVSNYTPGGVRIFNAQTLELVADIPAIYTKDGQRSKTVGLVDAPGRKFIFTLYDAGEIWIADCSACMQGGKPLIQKLKDIGTLPYDGLITGDGRIYIAGLFGEDGLALVDLWAETPKVQRILDNYGKGKQKLPVYKMPHLEGWAKANNRFVLPAVGAHEVLIIDATTLKETGRISVHGQPIFAMAHPDGRHIWVNFAHPRNDTVQVIDLQTMKIVHEFKPGKAVLHMEFTPRGEHVWISVRDSDRVDIHDTRTYKRIGSLKVKKPSGIFFTNRAGKIGL